MNDAPTMKYGPVKRRPVNLNSWNGGHDDNRR